MVSFTPPTTRKCEIRTKVLCVVEPCLLWHIFWRGGAWWRKKMTNGKLVYENSFEFKTFNHVCVTWKYTINHDIMYQTSGSQPYSRQFVNSCTPPSFVSQHMEAPVTIVTCQLRMDLETNQQHNSQTDFSLSLSFLICVFFSSVRVLFTLVYTTLAAGVRDKVPPVNRS